MKQIVIVLLLMMLMAGCAAAPEPTVTPTPTATPTLVPTPTNTPEPTATPDPCPKIEAGNTIKDLLASVFTISNAIGDNDLTKVVITNALVKSKLEKVKIDAIPTQPCTENLKNLAVQYSDAMIKSFEMYLVNIYDPLLLPQIKTANGIKDLFMEECKDLLGKLS